MKRALIFFIILTAVFIVINPSNVSAAPPCRDAYYSGFGDWHDNPDFCNQDYCSAKCDWGAETITPDLEEYGPGDYICNCWCSSLSGCGGACTGEDAGEGCWTPQDLTGDPIADCQNSQSISSGKNCMWMHGEAGWLWCDNCCWTAYASCGTPITVTCAAQSSPITRVVSGGLIIATATGGSGTLTYSWSGDLPDTGCSSSTSNLCGGTWSTAGVKTITVTVTDGTTTSDPASCNITVNNPPVNVTCTPTTTSVAVNQNVTFNTTVSGGDGSNYSYVWDNCSGGGTSSSCTGSFTTVGTKTITVTASSPDSQDGTATCTVNVTECNPADNNSNPGQNYGTNPNCLTLYNPTKELKYCSADTKWLGLTKAWCSATGVCEDHNITDCAPNGFTQRAVNPITLALMPHFCDEDRFRILTPMERQNCKPQQCVDKGSYILNPGDPITYFPCSGSCRETVPADGCGANQCFCPTRCLNHNESTFTEVKQDCRIPNPYTFWGNDGFQCTPYGVLLTETTAQAPNPFMAIYNVCGAQTSVYRRKCMPAVGAADPTCQVKYDGKYIPFDKRCLSPDNRCACWPCNRSECGGQTFFIFGPCGKMDGRWICYTCQGGSCFSYIEIRNIFPSRCVTLPGGGGGGGGGGGTNPHNACDAGFQCVSVNSVGVNACTTSTDCGSTFLNCNSSKQCVATPGNATDVCSAGDADLNGYDDLCELPVTPNYFYTCNAQLQCVSVTGTGANNCSQDSDCTGIYMGCNSNQQCVEVPGSLPDQCTTTDANSNGKADNCETHLACNISDQCVSVVGPGIPGCSTADNNSNGKADSCEGPDNPNPPDTELPEASNVNIGIVDNCPNFLPGCATFSVSWLYHSDDLVNQDGFILQIDDDSEFGSPAVNRVVSDLDNPSNTLNIQTVVVKSETIAKTKDGKYIVQVPAYLAKIANLIRGTLISSVFAQGAGDYLLFDTNYYIRVRVFDQNGNSSAWVPYDANDDTIPDVFHTNTHPYPYVTFYGTPTDPAPDVPVYFTENSVCYGPGDTSYACKDGGAAVTYTWDFGDESPTDDTKDTTTHIFTSTGNFNVTLTICDDAGQCCDSTLPFRVRTGGATVPNWREVNPF